MKVGEGYALLKSTLPLILFSAMSGWPLDVLRDTACAMLGYDARAKVETCEARGGEGSSSREEKQHKVNKEERLRGGEWLESQRGRQPICLSDDSPTLDIYSIRREGGTWRRGEPVGGRTMAWEASRTTSLCPSTGSGIEETDRSGGKQGEGGEWDWAQPADDRLEVEMRRRDRNREAIQWEGAYLGELNWALTGRGGSAETSPR